MSASPRQPVLAVAQVSPLHLQRLQVRCDGADVAAAKAHGAVVMHTPGVVNDDVAELPIGLTTAYHVRRARHG